MTMTPKVAFQGELGAFSEDAVRLLFGDCPVEPSATFRLVFERVAGGSADYGVVPIENSQAGSINETYQLLLEHELPIVGEVVVPVEQALLGVPGSTPGEIRRVLSHPQALAQSERYLLELGATIEPYYDTAGAARLVAREGRRDQAAVGAPRAAELYGLEVLAERIQTHPLNFTRFVVVASEPTSIGRPPSKTSIVFSAANTPGSLHRCLGAFAESGINHTKVESRPIGVRPWQYNFYIDFAAAADDPRAEAALSELASHSTFVRVLGTYPAWETEGDRPRP